MDEELTPAMRRWARMLREEGYSIRPRLRMERDGYMGWGPALYNASGGFVQNVRRDVFRRLLRLGIVEGEGPARGQGAPAEG